MRTSSLAALAAALLAAGCNPETMGAGRADARRR